MTDRNPREGPSFRTGLRAPPLILVVQLAGVHGNEGIVINKGFARPRSERPPRGTGPGTGGPGWRRVQPAPARRDRGPRPRRGPGKRSLPRAQGPGRGRGGRSRSPQEPRGPLGPELTYSSRRRAVPPGPPSAQPVGPAARALLLKTWHLSGND